MEITELSVLQNRHTNEERLVGRAIDIAHAFTQGATSPEFIDIIAEHHYCDINPASTRDITGAVRENSGKYRGRHMTALIDRIRLEKMRPSLQRVRMMHGLFEEETGEAPIMHVTGERTKIITDLVSEYDIAAKALRAEKFRRPDLKREFKAVMEGKPEDANIRIRNSLASKSGKPDYYELLEEAVRAYELNYLGQISDAHIEKVRAQRALWESDMAGAWLLHNARIRQRGIHAYNEAKARREFKKMGLCAYSALSTLHQELALDEVTLERFAKKHGILRTRQEEIATRKAAEDEKPGNVSRPRFS